jgi:hypothetical protein
MFFIKKNQNNNTTTFWAWTSADNKWTRREDAEEKIDDFLSSISTIPGIKHSEKKHHMKQWNTSSITDYYYVEVKYPTASKDTICNAVRSCGLVYASEYPFKLH